MEKPAGRSLRRLFCFLAACAMSGALRGDSAMADRHFDGKTYFNPWPGGTHVSAGRVIRKLMFGERPEWKRVEVAPSNPPQSVARGIRATWVGHATLLAQINGVNILTDPIWADRASPVSFAGPKRYAEPGVRFEDLPPVHFVTVSHNHYDHMNRETLQRLAKAHAPAFFVPMGNAKLLRSWGIENVTELDWWQSAELRGVEVHCVPAKHFCRRGLFDLNEALWSGWVVRSGSTTFYHAGDTGYFPGFAEIGKRFGGITLAALPIGAYHPAEIFQTMHVNPEEAVQAHIDLRAQRSVAMHWNTFQLTLEPQDEPPRRLKQAMKEKKISDEFAVLRAGESLSVTPGAR